jgi:hypothetical protein
MPLLNSPRSGAVETDVKDPLREEYDELFG